MEENVIEVLNPDTNPTLAINGNTYFAVSLMKERFVEEKEMINFIKSVERIIRSSPEYRSLTNYIKSELKLNYCAFLNNLELGDVSIELHHTPYNLHQLVEIVIRKHEIEAKVFNSYSIASEVMGLHFMNHVGLVPLSKSIHELVHSDQRFYIHRDLVLGDVDSFYRNYREYMSEELIHTYTGWKKYSDENELDRLNTLQLFDGQKRLEQLETIKELNSEYTINRLKDETFMIEKDLEDEHIM